jgi:hypothetical protein
MARDLPARQRRLDGPKTVANGRDAKGRFLPGNPGGGRPPSNPFARYQAELRGVLLAEVRPADLRAVVRQVLRLATRGHLPAVELLLKWTLGGPPPALDPDKLDSHEREVRMGRLTIVDQLAQGELPPAGEDPVAAPAETADEGADEDPLHPPLRTVLAWALEELSAAQTALRTQQPPPPDAQAGWEVFVAHHLEFDPQAAVDVDQLFVTYARWCGSHGELVLAEEKLLAWLTGQGATLRTGTHTQIRTLVGVKVTP